MKHIDKEIIRFIEKYPFFTDPIVLFNPKRIPSEKEIRKGKLKLKYPQIDKQLKNLKSIKKDFFKIKDSIQNTSFEDSYMKLEYQDRIVDFFKIIKIIEGFYNEEEYEKYNLINEYYGIDFKLLYEIFENKDILVNEFNNIKGKIDSINLKNLQNTFINSEEIKKYFISALKFLNLDKNWKVKVGNVVSIVHTNFTEKGGEIIIPEYYEISLKKLITLIAHEIDGHCMQFSNASGLLSGSIRFSKSESLIEGYAMYIEYLIESYFKGTNNIENMFNRNNDKYNIVNNCENINSYLTYFNNGVPFRFFRGFNDINKYKNLKDFVYIEGLYKIIKYKELYSNFLELIQTGAVNDYYINRYGITAGRKNIFKPKETSAYYIYYEYFKI